MITLAFPVGGGNKQYCNVNYLMNVNIWKVVVKISISLRLVRRAYADKARQVLAAESD